jgi:hypothetical protein
MIPKLWPKRLIYSRESVAVDMHIFLLREYISSGSFKDLEKTSWVIEEKCTYPHLEIKKTSLPTLRNQKHLNCHQNYGIFATQKIDAGTQIGEYVGELYLAISQESLQILLEKIFPSEYAWMIEINERFLLIDAQNVANELALINDYRDLGPRPNVKMQEFVHKGTMYFGYVAITNIQKGEELLVDYGPKFWDSYYKVKI